MSKLETLTSTRDKAVADYRSLLDLHATALETRSLTDDETGAADAAEKRVAQLDAAITAAEADETRAAAETEARARKLGAGVGGAVVTAEPLTYGPGNPDNSFIRDIVSASRFGPNTRDAMDRLVRHQHEVEVLALGPQNTPEARKARASLKEVRRASMESRDISTASGSLGDFAAPVYALSDYAGYRDYGRTFIDQCRATPLPATGMVIYLPKVTTPTEAINQTAGNGENGSVASQDMVASYATGNVQTFIVNSEVSQQYLDRVGPGVQGDAIVLTDQQTQLNKKLDSYALDQVFSTIQTQGNYSFYNDTSFEAQKYKQQVHAAKAAMATSEGTVAYPSHVFTDVTLWESIEGAFDSSNRPLVTPQGVAWNPIAVGDYANVPEGYTGFRFAGLPAFKDQNIWGEWSGNGDATPGYTLSHPTIVADLVNGLEWMEGEPVVRVLPQPYASTLTVLIQTFCYATVVFRYPNAFQAVIGSGTDTAYLI